MHLQLQILMTLPSICARLRLDNFAIVLQERLSENVAPVCGPFLVGATTRKRAERYLKRQRSPISIDSITKLELSVAGVGFTLVLTS